MSTRAPKKHIQKTKETMDNATWRPPLNRARISKTVASLGRRSPSTTKSSEPASVDGSITSSPPNPTPVIGTPENGSTLSINVEHTEKGSSSNVKSTSTKQKSKKEEKAEKAQRRKAEKEKKSSRSKSHEKSSSDKKSSHSKKDKTTTSDKKETENRHLDTKTNEKKHTDSHTKTKSENKTTEKEIIEEKENKTTEKEIIEEKETQTIEKTTTKEMNSEKILEETEPSSNEVLDTKTSDQQSSDEKLPKIGVIGVNSTLVKPVDFSTEESKIKEENDVQVGSPENKSTEIQSKENSVSEVNSSEIDSSSESSDTTETSTSVEDNTAENGSTGNISNEIETIDKMETSKPFDHRSQSTKPEITHDKKLVVHRAKYNKTGEIVALKIIDKTIVRKDQLETLSREIGFVKWCEHKYLLQVYDVLEDDDYIYEVLEYAPGGNLFQHITTTVLTEQQAQWIAYQTASSMFYLHSKGICHRDLKPENILLMSVDDFSIRLVDFGLAKQFKNDVLKTPCGTFDYAPPEILGVTIFVSMCGYYPFDGNSIAENIEQMSTGDINFDDDEWGSVSKNCKDFIRRCLTADVTKRLNIEGVLTHPWLCGQSVYSNSYFTDLLTELKEKPMDLVIAPKKITIERS
ncbi:hypothetical protein QTN25_001811 [Entamoeba marina]